MDHTAQVGQSLNGRSAISGYGAGGANLVPVAPPSSAVDQELRTYQANVETLGTIIETLTVRLRLVLGSIGQGEAVGPTGNKRATLPTELSGRIAGLNDVFDSRLRALVELSSAIDL